MLKTVVFYHDDSDGLASALSLYMLYKKDATYIAVQYKQPVPSIALDKETQLFIVDFSYPLDVLHDLQSRVASITIVDHHATAQKHLQEFQYSAESNNCHTDTFKVVFDLNKAGADLCWETFHPNTIIPYAIRLVSDRDLWKFQLADSKAFEAGVRSSGRWRDLSYWELLITDENAVNEVIENGKILLNSQNIFIDSFVKSRKFTVAKFRGLRCAIFNTTYLISDLGNAIYEQTAQPVDMTMSYFVTAKGSMVFSMRAPVDGQIDVGTIASSLGGGGHRAAASFSMPLVQGAEFVANLLKE